MTTVLRTLDDLTEPLAPHGNGPAFFAALARFATPEGIVTMLDELYPALGMMPPAAYRQAVAEIVPVVLRGDGIALEDLLARWLARSAAYA